MVAAPWFTHGDWRAQDFLAVGTVNVTGAGEACASTAIAKNMVCFLLRHG
jgi:hypothetical protein